MMVVSLSKISLSTFGDRGCPDCGLHERVAGQGWKHRQRVRDFGPLKRPNRILDFALGLHSRRLSGLSPPKEQGHVSAIPKSTVACPFCTFLLS